ncbi:TIGR04222 domain-containing membrane protein [Streptomyces erythrochromogenes]|uniref:TIGR04222 domain-containing membrane protein n=1 Tax=Streptomyces erythrochromogenes TaxID=285574 RepID=UPI00382854D5
MGPLHADIPHNRTDRRGATVLDVYEVAYLAAGPQRVAQVALLGLRERGQVGVIGPRTAGIPSSGP